MIDFTSLKNHGEKLIALFLAVYGEPMRQSEIIKTLRIDKSQCIAVLNGLKEREVIESSSENGVTLYRYAVGLPNHTIGFAAKKTSERAEENTELLVQKTAKRLNFKPPRLVTSDEYKPYKKAILRAFGKKRTPKRTGKRGRPKGPRYRPKNGLVYATVHKAREKGRVTAKSLQIRAVVCQ